VRRTVSGATASRRAEENRRSPRNSACTSQASHRPLVCAAALLYTKMLLTPGCSRLITDAPVTRVWSNMLTLPREDGCRQDPGRPIKVRYTRSAPPNAAERW
jgi:hypothetical protein